jgi:Putative Ig domain/PGAP1-like protein
MHVFFHLAGQAWQHASAFLTSSGPTAGWLRFPGRNLRLVSALGSFALASTAAVAAKPVITSATSANTLLGGAFSYQIVATNGPLSFTATGLPTGLSLDAFAGLISGVPEESGNFAITLGATNASGTATTRLRLAVLPPPPLITSPLAAEGQVGVAFSYLATANNVPTSFEVTGLPSGLKAGASNGKISGKPDNAGKFDIGLAATNAGGTTTATLTVTILPAPPVITSAKNAHGELEEAFLYQVIATGDPTDFNATGLPPGLDFDPTAGVIAGVPVVAGNFSVALAATNAGGTDTMSLKLTIKLPKPAITGATVAAGQAGVPFSYQIVASNSPVDYAATGLPVGLSLDTDTGLISGAPTIPGTFKVRLAATNAKGTGRATLTITVATSRPPVVSLNSTNLLYDTTTPVSLSFDAISGTSSIADMEIYRDGALVATLAAPASGSTWIFTESAVLPPGMYNYFARAYDANGTHTDSSIVVVSVQPVLPYTADFESSEGYSLGALNGQLSWNVGPGAAVISNLDFAHGVQSVQLSPNNPPTVLGQTFAAGSGQTIEFFDFHARPAGGTPPGTASTFTVEQSEFAFQSSDGQGTLQVFSGDGAGGGTWVSTPFTVPLDANNLAQNWVRLTARLDFTRQLWDLYANSQMVAADVPFINASSYLSTFQLQGDVTTASGLDDIFAGPANPLFADVNNDGIDDAWETAHGLSLSLNDRALSPSGNGVTVLQAYLTGTDPNDFYNSAAPTLAVVSGDQQSAPAGQFNPQPFVVSVVNAAGTSPLANAPVTFAVQSGGGQLAPTSTGSPVLVTTLSLTTDANGHTQAYYQQPSPADAQSQIAVSAGPSQVIFTTTSAGGPPTQIYFYATDFETSEDYALGSLDGQQGWSVLQGVAAVTNQEASSASQSVVLAGGTAPAQIAHAVSAGTNGGIVYVDCYARPSVESDASQSMAFDIGGARFRFGIAYRSDDDNHVDIETFDGDGLGGGQWIQNDADFFFGWSQASPNWIRCTVRLDYSKKTWDIYADGKIIAANLGLGDSTNGSLSSLIVTGDANSSSAIDHLVVGSANPLFADLNNDGVDDAWETLYGLSLFTDDRDLVISGGDGISVIQNYVNDGNPLDFFQGRGPRVTFQNQNGMIAADGLVSVKVAAADGTPFVNGTVSFSMTSGASQISTVPGGYGSSQITVQTDADGVARAYVNFTSATTADTLAIGVGPQANAVSSGDVIQSVASYNLSNPFVPVMRAEFDQYDLPRLGSRGYLTSTYYLTVKWDWAHTDYDRPEQSRTGSRTFATDPVTGTTTVTGSFDPLLFDLWQTEVINSDTSLSTSYTQNNGGGNFRDALEITLSNPTTTTAFLSYAVARLPALFGNLTNVAGNALIFDYGFSSDESHFSDTAAQFQFVWNTAANPNVPATAQWLVSCAPFAAPGQPAPASIHALYSAPVVNGQTAIQTFTPFPGKYGTYTIQSDLGQFAVDSNHDGQIKLPSEDASDSVSPAKPCSFWINDDNDNGNTSIPDCATTQVAGFSDLKDFIPVFLDIKKLVTALPWTDGVEYKLKQADGALKFVTTSLKRANAFDYKKEDLSYGLASTVPITAGGVLLDHAFLDGIRDSDQGIVLIEGMAATTQPLVLSVEKGGQTLAEISLALSIAPRILLLLHGMNSNVRTWDNFVNAAFFDYGASPDAGVIGNNGTVGPVPALHGGVRCYRLQFGKYDAATGARTGLDGLTVDSTDQVSGGLPQESCGDYEDFDHLGQEVDEAIGLLLGSTPFKNVRNVQIVLVGHSRGGIAGRAFLQHASVNKSTVVGLLTTGSPQQGSSLGAVYTWLTANPRHVYDSSTGMELMVSVPVSGEQGSVEEPVNWKDWSVVDWLRSPDTIADAWVPKPPLDIRRPVIGELAPQSDDFTSLNAPSAVASLPASNIIYGEIVYDNVPLGKLTLQYSVFDGFPAIVRPLTAEAKTFLLGTNASGEANTVATWKGDGLVPAAYQRFTTLHGFPGIGILPLTKSQGNVVHIDEPKQTVDLLQQLKVLVPDWVP